MKKIILLLGFIILLSSFVSADLTTNIWGAWTFNSDIGYNANEKGFKWTNAGTVNVSGISGTGLKFVRSDPDKVTSTNNTCPSGSFTVNIWFNSSAVWAENFEMAINKKSGSGVGFWFMYYNSYNLYMDYSYTGGVDETIISKLDKLKWYMVTFRFNGTAVDRFVNGTLMISQVRADVTCSTETWTLGWWTANEGDYWNGLIDELTIWNQAITNDEITSLWNGGVGTFYPFGGGADTTIPSFTTNQTNATASMPKINDVLQLNITVTDDVDIHSVKLATNQSGTLTNVSTQEFTGATDTSVTAIFNLSITANHTLMQWQVWANDSTGNSNVSALFDAEIRNTAPTITLTSPADNDHNNVNLTVDYTPNDADIDSLTCYLYVNDSLNVTDSSITLGSSNTITSLNMNNDGHYSWYINCTDTINYTITASRTYILDTINPAITVHSPANKSYHNSNFDINVSGSDTNLYILNYSFYNSTGGILQSNQSTATTETYLDLNDTILIANLQDGTYYINFSVSDHHTGGILSDKLTKGKKGEDSFFVNDNNIQYNMSIYFVEKDSKLTDTPSTIKSYMEFNKDNTKILFGFNVTVIKPETEFIFNIKIKNTDIKLINSKYKGHMIWYPYGTDFEGILYVNGKETDYTVETKLITNNEAEARIIPSTKLSGNDVVEFRSESIFGLNIVERQYEVYIDKTIPSFTNNATNASLMKINGNATFNITITDGGSGLSYYIFSWNGTGSWLNDTNGSISGSSAFLSINKSTILTGRNTIGYVWYANDSLNQWNNSEIRAFIVANTVPVVTNVVWRTEGGFKSGVRAYNQIIVEINATCTESIDNDLLGCNVTVTDPSNIVVNNQPMGNISSNYNYTHSILLDKIGTWTISATGYDGVDTSSSTATITVSITLPTIFDGIYGYDYRRLVNESTILTDALLYDYDTISQTINWSSFNSTYQPLKQYINYSKENQSIKTFITINFDNGNYSIGDVFTNNTCIQINNNFTDFKVAPFDEAIQFILINLNTSQDDRVNFTNSIAECLVNATGNKFPIYVNYTNASLDSNWVSAYNLINITATSNQSFINQELHYLRTSTSLTRIYYDLANEQRSLAEKYHDDIITKIRGTPIAVTLANSTVAEIDSNNGDIIIFNNLTSEVTNMYDSSGAIRNGKDVWDSTQKIYIESNNDGLINVTIPSLSFVNVYFDDIDHLTLTSVWKSSATSNQVYGWNRTDEVQGTYSIVGANDLMFHAWDSSYGHNNQFFAHYEWINTSYVVNYSSYCNNGVVIIADYNSAGINNSISCRNKTFGYISVADYVDTDAWETDKKNNISVWLDNYGIQVFLDGLDTATLGANFATRFRSLVNFIEVQKNKTCIANDYTSYATAGVGGICEYDMKESFCGRWDGTVGTPTYSWEDFNTDLDRAKWARTNGNPQLAMAFGDLDDINKMQYCYAEYLVLYGTSNGNLYRYGQPNFQAQQEIFTFDEGTQLENTWTEVNTSYYYRKFSNGKVWINPTTHVWDIENNRMINNLTLAFKMQIYASSAPASTSVSIDVNGYSNVLPAISYTEVGLVQWASNTVYRNISALYNHSGRYTIRMHSGTPANPVGMNIYNSKVNNSGVFSFYENSVSNPPEIGGTWTAYGRSGTNGDNETTNWLINLILNDTTSAEIDSGITDITQTNSSDGIKYMNVTFNSAKSYNTEIWGNIVSTELKPYNLSYWNGTIWKNLSLIETLTCDSNNPLFASTTIDGQTHKSCYKNDSGVYKIRIAVPSLSSKLYQLDNGFDIIVPSSINNQTNATASMPKINDVLQLNITVTDDVDIHSVKLATNQSGTLTNVSTQEFTGATDTSVTAIFNLSITANHTLMQWQVWANDSTGNSNVSALFTVEIRNTAPITPTIYYPVNGSNYTDILHINFSSTDADNDAITYKIYINNTLNITTATNVTNWNASDGYYNLTITASDISSVSANSSVSYFMLDSTLPSISNLINRTIDDGTSIFYTNDNIYCNATITDNLIGINTVIFSWNDSSGNGYNNTVTSLTNLYSFNITSINISTAGNKWLGWRYYANDSVGNMRIGDITNYFVNPLVPTPSEGATTGAGASGSLGARGGGCWLFANEYKTCYYINGSECVLGCPEGYECNLGYNFDLVVGETLNYCVKKHIDATSNNTAEVVNNVMAFTDSLISRKARDDFKNLTSYLNLRYFKGSWTLFLATFISVVYISYLSFSYINGMYQKRKRVKKKIEVNYP